MTYGCTTVIPGRTDVGICKRHLRVKRPKRELYCDVRAVSHSCDVLIVITAVKLSLCVFHQGKQY